LGGFFPARFALPFSLSRSFPFLSSCNSELVVPVISLFRADFYNRLLILTMTKA